MGLSTGDQLAVQVEDGVIIARPRASEARRALREIRRILAEYGPSLGELHEEGQRIRRDIFEERYGKKAKGVL